MPTRWIVLLALVCFPAASAGPAPIFEPATPDAFLAWNAPGQRFNLFLLDEPLVTVDDSATPDDDRSLDVLGEPYEAERYAYAPRVERMRIENAGYPDGYLDVRVQFPEAPDLEALEAYSRYMHGGVKLLVAYHLAPPCSVGFATMDTPVAARFSSLSDFWVFAGALPVVGAWWGTMAWCQ